MRIFLIVLLLGTTLFSRNELYPTSCCPAYNNMKHTRNSGDVRLDPRSGYEVKQHHKEQYLIQIPGANPAQRWVDDSCLAPKSQLNVTPVSCEVKPIEPKSSNRENPKISSENLLALSWHNAFCEMHRYKKECKRGWKSLLGNKRGDDSFVLHGLWPQPREKVYCNVPRRYITADRHKQWNRLPEPKLTRNTKARLHEAMPGIDSNLHRHEWIKHGTCYGTDAERYFDDAIALTDEVRRSKITDFFRKNSGKRVTLLRIRGLFDKYFGKGAGRHIALHCKQGMITELWIDLNGEGRELSKLLNKGRGIRSSCQSGIIDKAGYRR